MKKILPYIFLVLAVLAVLFVDYVRRSENKDIMPDIQYDTETKEETGELENDDFDLNDEAADESLIDTSGATPGGAEDTNTEKADETEKAENTSSSQDKEKIESLPASFVIDIDEDNFIMTLVNRKYRMPDDYSISLKPCLPGSDISLYSEAADYYHAMYEAAEKEGCYLTPYSGYRRYSTQKTNYENKIQHYRNQGYNIDEAKTLAARIIMPPGSSEHNLGLAMDICGTRYDFDQTKEFKWLMRNAENYGFILRYRQDKQHITKVVYEPWHWRYVGVENAKRIKASGLCMEEYLNKDAG